MYAPAWPPRVPVVRPGFRLAPWPCTSAPCLRVVPGLLRGGPGRPRHSALTPSARRDDPGAAGSAGQARGASTGRSHPAASAPGGEPSAVAAAPAPPGSGVGGGLGRPVARLGDRGLADRRRGPAGLLQPDPEDGQRAGWPRRNRSVDHDRGPVPGRRVSARDGRGPGRRPGACPHPAGRRGPVQHRHRRISRTGSRLDTAAPRLDCARRGRHRGLACAGRPARAAAAADPEQPRPCRRDRRVHGPARLARHRNPGWQRPGPG
jgi:hypothetical protein